MTLGILEQITKNKEASIALLFDYLRTKGVSITGEGIQETVAFLKSFLSEMGFSTASRSVGSSNPFVFGSYVKDSKLPTLLIYGHYDVQPEGPVERWTSPPFSPSIRNGKMYARGVGDNKGQHFAHLIALKTYLTANGTLPCNVKILLEGEEEVGSPHVASYVEQHKAELSCDIAVVSDGHVHTKDSWEIVCGVRGLLCFELRCKTAERDVHSGNFGNIAPNPFWKLIWLLSTMRDPSGRVLIDEFYDNVMKLGPAERAAAEKIPHDERVLRTEIGISEYEPPAPAAFFERTMASPTFTISGFTGGYSGEGIMTIVPHAAAVKCDVRLVHSQSAEEIYKKICRHVQKNAPGIEVVLFDKMEPSFTPMDSPYTKILEASLTKSTGKEPIRVPCLGGSLPTSVFRTILGAPTYIVPFGEPDEANHAPDENLSIARFMDGIKFSVILLDELSKMPSRGR